MKQFLLMAALLVATGNAFAQDQPTTGDYYQGMSKKITFDKVIPVYGVEVTFEKTVHLIFPSAIRYVDLGSQNIIAGKADGAENVLRIKASQKGFKPETNFSVITEDGNFFTFNVKYADEPEKLNIEVRNLLKADQTANQATKKSPVYLKELAEESPMLVKQIVNTIYTNNNREIKHIGDKKFGVEFSLRGIYTHNGLFFFHTQLKNLSNIPHEIDFMTIKIVDKKLIKRTAIQERVLEPVRSFNQPTFVSGQSSERSVFVLERFTIPDDKLLVVELFEKNGGRNLKFLIDNNDLVNHTKSIHKLK